jgi:hypothetical protein
MPFFRKTDTRNQTYISCSCNCYFHFFSPSCISMRQFCSIFPCLLLFHLYSRSVSRKPVFARPLPAFHTYFFFHLPCKMQDGR